MAIHDQRAVVKLMDYAPDCSRCDVGVGSTRRSCSTSSVHGGDHPCDHGRRTCCTVGPGAMVSPCGMAATALGKAGVPQQVLVGVADEIARVDQIPGLPVIGIMRQARLNARIVHRLFPRAPKTRLARALAASQVSGHPFRVPYGPARDTIAAMAEAPGFRETLRALVRTRFVGGAEITVPVTVAFGTRDRVLLPVVSRRRKELPAQTRWIRLTGCGHVPMFDDPRATADLLLAAEG